MAANSDLEILKDIPGYKAILKSVLKSQIQLLIAQLADQTGEESIILTASLNDGTMSHLGSNTGLGFLDGRDEIKSQFLGYCLNNHHSKVEVTSRAPCQRSRTVLPPSRRPRIRPSPYAMPSSSFSTPIRSPSSYPISPSVQDESIFNHSNNCNPKFVNENIVDNLLDNVTSSTNSASATSCNAQDSASNQNTAFSNSSQPFDIGLEGSQDAKVKVKVEAVSGDDADASGIDAGETSQSSDAWGQQNFDQSMDGNGTSEDLAEYTSSDPKQTNQASHPLGGIAFPGLDNAHHDFKNFAADLSPSELNRALYPEGNTLPNTMNYSLSQRKGSSYWCLECNKPLQNRNLYEYHLRAHSGIRPYECEVCHRKLAGKQVLETHMRLHSGEKPFRCDIPGCCKAFSARSGLVYHKRKHHLLC